MDVGSKMRGECYLHLAIKINLNRRGDGSAESVDVSDEAELIHLEAGTAVPHTAAPACL